MQLQKKVNRRTILLTSANYFTIAKFRYSFISKLISNGHKVVLYSAYDDMSLNSIEALEKLGAICIKTGSSRGSYSLSEAIKYLTGYIQILSKYSVDVSINFTLMPMILGGLICRFKKISFISVITGLGSQYHGNFVKRLLLKLAYGLSVKYSNQIWFVSHSDAKIGINELYINIKKIRVVYGAGININYGNNTVIENNIVKDSLKTKIIYMGRIRRDKGIEDFIELANQLSSDNRFSFVLMGSMDSSDRYIKNIVKKAIQNNTIKKIDFNYDNLPHLKSSDILLLCSWHEGMPTVILESMANFVVPIAANIDVIDELNEMGATIFSYMSGNIDSLQKKIKEIEALTFNERDIILKKNHKFVSRHFDRNKIANLQYRYFLELKK